MHFAGTFLTALTTGETCPICTCHLNLLCSYRPWATNCLKELTTCKGNWRTSEGLFFYAGCLCTEARFAQGSKSQCVIPGWHWPSPCAFLQMCSGTLYYLGPIQLPCVAMTAAISALPLSLLILISRPQSRQSYLFQTGSGFASGEELQKSLTIMDLPDTHHSLFA